MYRSIVVGTDCTDTASVAVEHAAQLACAVGACLHVVSVYQEPATVAIAQTGYVAPQSDGWSEMAVQDRQRQVDSIATRLRGRDLNVTAHVMRGDPRSAILAVAHEVDADLIVVGSRGLNGIRRVFGSVPNAVTHNKEFHVLIVRTA
jgi:nucleotide-binding universal stress UspA family protein